MSLELPSTVGRAEAEMAAATLVERINQSEPLVIDAGKVDRIGLAGLQMLLSAKSSAHAAGVAFRIENHSEPLSEMAILAGLDDLLSR